MQGSQSLHIKDRNGGDSQGFCFALYIKTTQFFSIAIPFGEKVDLLRKVSAISDILPKRFPSGRFMWMPKRWRICWSASL